MGVLTVYELDNPVKWDEVVRSFEHYDAYWLSGYVKAFQLHGDGEPLLFFYDDENLRGINVVMKRDVAQDPHFMGKLPEGCFFDFSTPYGYGGWIIEGENTEQLFQAYHEWTKQNGIISEFVRFHPMLKNHEQVSPFYDVEQLGEVVHMELSDREEIWENITSKNRNMIRKAMKNDVKIRNGQFSEIRKDFRAIYDRTMDKDHADRYYYFGDQFYESVCKDLSNNTQAFWAEKDGEIIAASIMLVANGYMNYHLSGSLKEFGSLAPTNLLLYEAALWGNLNGCRSLYLGGGVGSGEDGLFKFKRSFYKGELNCFYIGKKIFDQAKYKELVDMRSEPLKKFFPAYRAMETQEGKE